jgi:hypothetical protein
VVAFARGEQAGHPSAAAEGAVTKILSSLVKAFIFVAALLGPNLDHLRGVPSEHVSLSLGAPTDAAAQEAFDAAPNRASGACPPGQCVVGRTNVRASEPLCGPCPARRLHPVPPPAPTFCPKRLAPGAYVYLADKAYGHGFDSTPRVHGDPEFCYLIHHVQINDCHLESWPTRTQCELELMHGCPIWQYTADGTTIHGCFDDSQAAASCDHFGSVGYQDDPQTPTTGDTIWNLKGFEGRPLECGLQRNAHGPMAGFFTVAHGIGNVRACKPDGTRCGPWRAFNH